MSNRYVPSSIMVAGVIVVGIVGYLLFSTIVSNPADFTTAVASTAVFRPTLWVGRALDVLAQGAVVLSGVLGVVVLLRGIRI